MLIDQAEIDSLLSQASALAEEAGEALGVDESTDSPRVGAVQRAARLASAGAPRGTPELGRLLSINVPVIVQLAARKMPVSLIRKFAPGAIIEFEKSVEDDLELMINNGLVGRGLCVKVGEKFGLRISNIITPAQRVRSLGES